MSFLLKEMSTVKLRSVARLIVLCEFPDIIVFPLRSPGGTPLKTKSQNTSVPIDSDPAAIIAHALQRKFSHSVFSDSPGQ